MKAGLSSVPKIASEAFVKPTQDEFGRILEIAGSSITGNTNNTSQTQNFKSQQSGNKPDASQKTPDELVKIRNINSFIDNYKKDNAGFHADQQRIKQEKAQQVQIEMDQKKKTELDKQQNDLQQPSSKGGVREKIGDMWNKARRVEVKGKASG